MLEAGLLPGERRILLAGDPSPLGRLLRDPDTGVGDLSDLEQPFVSTIVAPGARLTLRMRRAGREWLADGRLGPLLAITLCDDRDESPEHLVVGALGELPRIIADLVDLGPRPLDPTWPEIVAPYEPLDACAGVGCEPATLDAMQHAFAGFYPAGALAALFDGAALRWTLTVESDDGAGMAVDLVDAGERGLWLLDTGSSAVDVTATPISSTAVWVLLSRLMAGAEYPERPATR